MGFRFSKSIKLGDYLRLNFSKSGVSATVGPKGASVNVGKKGTYLNLSPAAVGIKGTGLSYRTKIADRYSSVKKKNTSTSLSRKTSAKTEKKEIKSIENTVNPNDQAVVDKYYKDLEARCFIHKYADDVTTQEDYIAYITTVSDMAEKVQLNKCLKGDEETIEAMCGEFMANLEYDFDIKCSYELKEHTLCVDLDLPEIEDIKDDYPAIDSKNTLVSKKKTQSEIRQEYAYMVTSLPVFLSAQFFNISPFINTITISGYTQVRDKKGDLINQYLYSVRFTRNIFEQTDFSTIDSAYDFILKFDNRINMSNNSFKAITPYEMILEEVKKSNELLDEAVEALKALGYKVIEINNILPELSQETYDSVNDYIRKGLQLLNK